MGSCRNGRKWRRHRNEPETRKKEEVLYKALRNDAVRGMGEPGAAVLADHQMEEVAAEQTACDVENSISLTAETVAGRSGHALSGQMAL